MKKYIKFVLGLILVSVMINPIIKFFTGGEQEVINAIKKYENIFHEGIGEESETAMTQSQIEAFKNNLNNNCDNLLKTEFSDKDFKSNIQCDIDLENMTYNIQSLEVGVKETGIKLVDNIRININRESQEVISKEEVIGNSEEIKKYLQETFNIPIEKIKLYSMNK